MGFGNYLGINYPQVSYLGRHCMPYNSIYIQVVAFYNNEILRIREMLREN